MLCSDNDKTVMKGSVLKENKQISASKYYIYLLAQEDKALLLGT